MKYLSILLLLHCCFFAFSQRNIGDTQESAIIEINPFGSDKGISRLPYGSKVKFKINNVNSYKLFIENTVVKQAVTFEMPQGFSMPDDKNINAGDVNLFLTAFKGFVTTLNRLILYNSINSQIDGDFQETFIQDINRKKSDLRAFMISVNDGDTDLEKLRIKCRTVFDSLTFYYVKAQLEYDKLPQQNQDAEKNILKFLIDKYKSFDDDKVKIQVVINTNSGLNNYHAIQSSNFTIFTDAVQLNEDKVTITPKLKNMKGDIVKEFSPLEIKTYGGCKVDISTGYLLSFRGDNNFSNLYDSSGIAGVQKNKKDDIKSATGILFHVYKRSGKDLNMALTAGVSIPVDGHGIGYYGGVSLLFLEKNRLVFTIGLAETRIQELNSSNLTRYPEAERISGKESYKFSNETFKEINYNQVYRTAIFIGLTYNIFRLLH